MRNPGAGSSPKAVRPAARPVGDLATYLSAAGRGDHLPVDFRTDLLPHPSGPASAVLGFTGHHVIAADVSAKWLAAQADPDDFGYSMRAPFLAALGERLGVRPGHLDLVLVTEGEVPGAARHRPAAYADEVPPLRPIQESAHPRLARARLYRDDVVGYCTPGGEAMLMLGRGLAGRLEVSFEVAPAARGGGLGRWLAAEARKLVDPGELLYAQVSPGNVASVRAVLAAGYRPIGSEVLFLDGDRRSASQGDGECAPGAYVH